MTRSIHICNSSLLEGDELASIARDIEVVLPYPVDYSSRTIDHSIAFDRSRKQYNSSVLLAQLLEDGIVGEAKTIAIVDIDLFVPVLTFVFGEAQFSGRAAIVSLQRLGNEFYGLPKDSDLLRQRLAKEIVHELGHTFGLYHCRQFECVMRSSTYVEEIDLKKIEFCRHCNSLLQLTHTI